MYSIGDTEQDQRVDRSFETLFCGSKAHIKHKESTYEAKPEEYFQKVADDF